MKHWILSLAFLASASTFAQAQTQEHAPEGILVRVDAKGNRVVVPATLEKENPSESDIKAVAEELIAKQDALEVKKLSKGSELDDESSTDSWYWYWNPYSYNYYYNYYGWNYTYYNYYSWYNYGYRYYYYRWW